MYIFKEIKLLVNPFVPNASFLYPLKHVDREKVHLEQMVKASSVMDR